MPLDVGDVLAVRTAGLPAKLIEEGAALEGKPNLDNHIVGVHHFDASGVPWGIEGRPGGVGWVDLRKYLGHPLLVNNCGQPKTDAQRATLATYIYGALGTPYDWEGIVLDAMRAIHAPAIWQRRDDGGVAPAHVVCSSLYAYAYAVTTLKHPVGPPDRIIPGDWTLLMLTQPGWNETLNYA